MAGLEESGKEGGATKVCRVHAAASPASAAKPEPEREAKVWSAEDFGGPCPLAQGQWQRQ